MGRRWNRAKSWLYTRVHGLSELWARLRGAEDADAIPLPALARPGRPLAAARVALLTTAGVHQVDQPPFDMDNPDGDAGYRLIAGDVPLERLRITHDYYDHHAADRDLNCVFPLERLRELASAGVIGAVAPHHVGMMGHILGLERERLVHQTAAAVARLFVADAVDLVLATPG